MSDKPMSANNRTPDGKKGTDTEHRPRKGYARAVWDVGAQYDSLHNVPIDQLLSEVQDAVPDRQGGDA